MASARAMAAIQVMHPPADHLQKDILPGGAKTTQDTDSEQDMGQSSHLGVCFNISASTS